MKLTKLQVRKFRRYIFEWWTSHRRDLPWRHTHDPYKIFISEVMLQQTQVLRVSPKYREFIQRYPTIKDLANASTADILRMWKGMGYNRRALYLKKTAEVIVTKYKGKFPESGEALVTLPGLGRYTAAAILVFAYKKDVALVDTNIRQIITHFFFGDKKQKESAIENVAQQLVPRGTSWEWHQALMDYGALELTKMPGMAKKQSTFKNSNRYYRGVLIDMLREGSVRKHILLKKFSSNVIDGLKKDGLIEMHGDMVSLPD